MLLNTNLKANIHLVMNRFGTLFHDDFFPDISLTWFKFPDISRFSRQVVILCAVEKTKTFSEAAVISVPISVQKVNGNVDRTSKTTASSHIRGVLTLWLVTLGNTTAHSVCTKQINIKEKKSLKTYHKA